MLKVLYDLKEERILTFDQMCFLKKNIDNNFIIFSKDQSITEDFTNVLLRNLFLYKNNISILINNINDTKIKSDSAVKEKTISIDKINQKDLIVFPTLDENIFYQNSFILQNKINFIFCVNENTDLNFLKQIKKPYISLFLDKTKKPYRLNDIKRDLF